MKKLSVLVLGFSALLASCSTEENIYIDSRPVTDVRVKAKAAANEVGVSSRSVNRGDIPVTVKDITVNSISQLSSIERNQLFTLVEDGSGSDDIIMNDVPLGENDFSATTTASGNNRYSLQLVSRGTDIDEYLEGKKLITPYVVYNGSTESAYIDGEDDFVSIDMSTLNGRRISMVELDDSIKDEYYYKVVMSTENNPTLTETVTNGKKRVVSVWSNSSSVDGAWITFDLTLYSNINDEIVNTYSVTKTIEASKGITSRYTIYENTVQSEQVGFGFVWQDWSEVEESN
jgi:hypothetical protein